MKFIALFWTQHSQLIRCLGVCIFSRWHDSLREFQWRLKIVRWIISFWKDVVNWQIKREKISITLLHHVLRFIFAKVLICDFEFQNDIYYKYFQYKHLHVFRYKKYSWEHFCMSCLWCNSLFHTLWITQNFVDIIINLLVLFPLREYFLLCSPQEYFLWMSMDRC